MKARNMPSMAGGVSTMHNAKAKTSAHGKCEEGGRVSHLCPKLSSMLAQVLQCPHGRDAKLSLVIDTAKINLLFGHLNDRDSRDFISVEYRVVKRCRTAVLWYQRRVHIQHALTK